MYRIKWGCLCLAGLLLTGCAGKNEENASAQTGQDLMLEVLNQGADKSAEGSANVTTKEISYGDIVTNYSDKAYLYFPYQKEVTYDNEYARIYFQGFLVEQDSYVKEGDALAQITLWIDPIDIEELSLEYERELEGFERECRIREEELLQAQSAVEAAAGGIEQQRAQLSYEQLLREYEMYCGEELDKQAELKERLEVCQNISKNPDVTIKAEKDGYVTDFAWLNAGTEISAGTVLMTFHDTAVWYYEIEDSLAMLRYGMEVSMRAFDSQDSDVILTGTVVCADNILNRMARGTALIAVESIDGKPVGETFGAEDLPQTVEAVMHPISIKQVLIVPESCVLRSNSNFYVNIYENGIRKKVSFISPYSVNGSYWALYGLDEGDICVAD